MTEDFYSVMAAGLGVQGAHDGEFVFVETSVARREDAGVRVGTLARLLSDGEDWDRAALATGFEIRVRPCVDRRAGVGVELTDGTILRLDLFAFALDPIGSVIRMFADANGRA
jgi:hypothetical protein